MSNSYYVKTNWDLYEDLSKPYQWSRSNDKDGTTKGTEAVVREQNKKDVMAVWGFFDGPSTPLTQLKFWDQARKWPGRRPSQSLPLTPNAHGRRG